MSHPSSAIDSTASAVHANSPQSQLPPLVLVVEDDTDTRDLYRYVLESKGLRVIEAQDGEQGVCMAQSAQPDLILMDTTLPHVDGLSATVRMRTHEALRAVPIIFLSGHAQPQARMEALASGGNDYLVKPVDPNELELAVERHLKLGTSRRNFGWT